MQKERMRHDERARDEESLARQEQTKRDTLEYEYQLKASLKQQVMQEELRAKAQLMKESQQSME